MSGLYIQRPDWKDWILVWRLQILELVFGSFPNLLPPFSLVLAAKKMLFDLVSFTKCHYWKSTSLVSGVPTSRSPLSPAMAGVSFMLPCHLMCFVTFDWQPDIGERVFVGMFWIRRWYDACLEICFLEICFSASAIPSDLSIISRKWYFLCLIDF